MVGGTVLSLPGCAVTVQPGRALVLVTDKRYLRCPDREADMTRLSLGIAVNGTHGLFFLEDAVFVSGMHKKSPYQRRV